MSFLVKIVFLAFVLVVTAKPMTEEEKQSFFKQAIGNCQAKEGASDADVQELISHSPPSTRTGQCLHACISETVGFIKDGKVSVEGSVKIAQMSGDADKIKNAEVIAKECESVGGADRCDTSMQIMQCIAKAATARGLDPKSLI